MPGLIPTSQLSNWLGSIVCINKKPYVLAQCWIMNMSRFDHGHQKHQGFQRGGCIIHACSAAQVGDQLRNFLPAKPMPGFEG